MLNLPLNPYSIASPTLVSSFASHLAITQTFVPKRLETLSIKPAT